MAIVNNPSDKECAEVLLAQAKVSALTAKLLGNKYQINIEDRRYVNRCKAAAENLENGDYKLSFKISDALVNEVKVLEEIDSIAERLKNLEKVGVD